MEGSVDFNVPTMDRSDFKVSTRPVVLIVPTKDRSLYKSAIWQQEMKIFGVASSVSPNTKAHLVVVLTTRDCHIIINNDSWKVVKLNLIPQVILDWAFCL